MGMNVEPDLLQPDLGNDSSIRKAYAKWFGDFEERNGRQPNQHEVMKWAVLFLTNNSLVKGKPREELNIAFTAAGVLADPNKKLPENALCVTCHKKITDHTPEMLEDCGRKQHVVLKEYGLWANAFEDQHRRPPNEVETNEWLGTRGPNEA